MITIRPAAAADIDAIVALLHAHMNTAFSPARWRRLFAHQWCNDAPDLGRVAEWRGEIAGCVAAIYSTREIDGSRYRFCNPAAWYLRAEARDADMGAGLALMESLTRDTDTTYVALTSSKNTIHPMRWLGFTVLDREKYVWCHDPATCRRGDGLTLITDTAALHARTGVNERRILADHAGLPVHPVFVDRGNGPGGLIIFADSIKGEGERWLDVLYVSDPTLLATDGGRIAARLLDRPGTFMAADCRFAATPPAAANRVALPVPRFVKSAAGLAPDRIDHLYSELQLLDQKLR